MTKKEIEDCLKYAEELIANRVARAVPRCGGDIYSRGLGGRQSFWLEPPITEEDTGQQAVRIDFYVSVYTHRYGNISYDDVNDSWDSESTTPPTLTFYVIFDINGQPTFFSSSAFYNTIYQDYSAEPPFPEGFNKQDVRITITPSIMPFPVKVLLNQRTTINGVTTIDIIEVDFNSTGSQTLDFSLDVYGDRVTEIIGVVRS